MTGRPWAGITLALLAAGSPADAQAQCEVAKLQASDAEIRDQFGEAVMLSGDVMLVGAPHEEDNGEKAGAAYVYRLQAGAWVFEQKIIAHDGGPDDEFSGRVALDGDLAAIMAIFDNDNGSNSGSVYLYRHDGLSWALEQKLPGGRPLFATSIALDGDRLLIGAGMDDADGPEAGAAAAYGFDGLQWTLEQQLAPAVAMPLTRFGAWVAVDGATAMISAPFGGEVASAGVVHVFELDGASWVETQVIASPDGSPGDEFGTIVCLDGDTALIGAPRHDDAGVDLGAAYVFRHDGVQWVQEQKLLPVPFAGERHFGERVALEGDTALVAAPPGFGPDVESAGASYVYERAGVSWSFARRLEGSDTRIGDNFGWGLALSGDNAAAGAMFHDEPELNEGAVYAYDLPACLATLVPATLDMITVQKGVVLAGDVESLVTSDEDALLVDAEPNAAGTSFSTIVTVFAGTTVVDVSEVSVTVEIAAEDATALGAVRIRNFDTDRWQLLGAFTITADDQAQVLHAPPDAASFVDPLTGEIRLQLVSRANAVAAPEGYALRADLVRIEVTDRSGGSR